MEKTVKFESKGNIELLSQRNVALFASVKTPKEIYYEAQLLVEKMVERNFCLAGGWQAPLEKEILNDQLKKGKANIIFYTAKDIKYIKMKEPLQPMLEKEKLLILSPESKKKRVSKADIDLRDMLILDQIKHILFLYIDPGGRLETYYNYLVHNKISFSVLDHDCNRRWLTSDCSHVNSETIETLPT